jgi:tripartite-type tricarboxylate transporter receptor subunit TctC
VVHPGVPANNLGELVALSKTRSLNFAVTALGSAPHLAGVAVEQASGAKWTYIPYKGGAQSVADTIAGQTDLTMNGMLATLPHVQSGKLKVLAVSKGTRVPLLANVPTVAEQGLKGFESGTWQGVLAPASMPPAVLAKLNTVLTEIIRSPEVRERLVSQGAEVRTMTTAEFASFFDAERKRWAQVVTKGGVKLD